MTYFAIRDNDGDLIEVEGDALEETVTVTLNNEAEDDAIYTELSLYQARDLTRALGMVISDIDRTALA